MPLDYPVCGRLAANGWNNRLPAAQHPGPALGLALLATPTGALLGDTFSKAVFLGSGLMAIVSGLVGNVLVEDMKLGPVGAAVVGRLACRCLAYRLMVPHLLRPPARVRSSRVLLFA